MKILKTRNKLGPKENILTHFIENRADNRESITEELILHTLFPENEESSELLVSVPSGHYLASAIARAVEDCDAHVLNLNVLGAESGERIVALRIDHRNAQAVARSIERYGMQVIDIFNSDNDDGNNPSAYDETARQRAQEILRYLSI